MNLQNLKDNCVARINEAYQLVEAHYGLKLPRPTIEFSNALTRCAGKAYYGRNHIKLSTPILELNGIAFIKDTPGHEAAHLISEKIYGRAGTGHGARWKSIMNLIGQPANRYHNFEVPKKANAILAKCACTTYELSSVRANRLQAGTAEYSCRKCKGTLSLVTQVTPKLRPTTPTQTKRKASKAEIVRVILSGYKASKLSLEEALHDINAIEFVMQKANLSKSLAQTYIKNNWNKA